MWVISFRILECANTSDKSIDSNPLILSLFSARLISAATTLYEFFSEKSFVLTKEFLRKY